MASAHIFCSQFRRLVAGWLLLASLSAAGALAHPANPSPQPSPRPLSQQLAHTARPGQLEVDFSWAGLSATHPIEHYHLQWLPGSQQYQVTGKRQLISNRDKRSQDQEVQLKLPPKVITELLQAVAQAPWTPATAPARVISHTDDYPNFSVTFTLKPQHKPQQNVRLFSVSNPRHFVPWNLVINRQIYTSPAPEVGIAVLTFFSYLRETRKAS